MNRSIQMNDIVVSTVSEIEQNVPLEENSNQDELRNTRAEIRAEVRKILKKKQEKSNTIILINALIQALMFTSAASTIICTTVAFYYQIPQAWFTVLVGQMVFFVIALISILVYILPRLNSMTDDDDDDTSYV